ncbi:peptidase M48 [Vitreoscilla sp. C1]|nr:peptidase M48 [Vitreoscilla sp. C1]
MPDDFNHQISLDEHQKAADYTLAKQRLLRYEILFQAALLLIWTLGGGLNLIASLSAKWFAYAPMTQGVVMLGLFALTNSLLSLPFALYRTFKLEQSFGFNRNTLGQFLNDTLKTTAVVALISVPVLYVLIYLMGSMGTNWWLWVWMVWVGLSLGLLWAYPKWIAPLFNQFTPIPEGDLKQRIEALLTRTGFASNGLFVVDGSKRSGHSNAYFTGFGKQKRIVFYDTLLTELNDKEVEAVLAHELGHFKHGHITQQISIQFVLGLAVLWILSQLLNLPEFGFFNQLGVHYPSHAMALLLFMLILPVFTFPFSPLASLMSRRNEYQADRFAAQHSEAADLISALTKLYRSNASTLTPDAWHSRFYASHPNANERIAALKQAGKH